MDKNSIKSVLQDAQNRLATLSDSPALDAEILLSHCLGKERSYLHTWPENIPSNEQLDHFHGLIEKRLTDYPIAYLVGTKPFWTLDLIVTPDVLIPRPETELLVETALEKIEGINNPKILDLGTGSGAIALALASERPDAKVLASDNSKEALLIAKENARKCKLSMNVDFIRSNWFNGIDSDNFDLIVSNPPYIAPDDPHLKQSIRHEPDQALVSNSNGIKDIKLIINNANYYLKQNAWLMLEHGYDQGNETLHLFEQANFRNARTLKDLFNNERISIAQFSKS